MTIAEEALTTGRDIVASPEANVASTINGGLAKFVGWPYELRQEAWFDLDGRASHAFASVVCMGEGSGQQPASAIISDRVAAVIDTSESLDLDSFRSAYARIAAAKRHKKTPSPRVDGTPSTNVTLGIILARRSALPLEVFAEEVERLNAQTPSREWPDMIVIAGIGVINYAIQFPGEGLGGDFLPPQDGGVSSYTPPVYVVIVLRPVGEYWFNKMAAFLVAHLAIFSPGAKLPNFMDLLEGSSSMAVTCSGFQYNLKGELVPVPRQFYNDRYFPPRPLRIEDRNGKLLATIQFLPWQEGGAVMMTGKMPLEAIMVFLGKVGLTGGVIRPNDTRISNVIPITAANFNEMLNRFQAQSNMVVKDPGKWVIQKFADEGSTSPYMARLFMGIMRFRDIVYMEPAKREQFDKRYELVNSSLMNARATAKEIVDRWEEHTRKCASGEVVKQQGQNVTIEVNVDKELRRDVETFLNGAVRTLKMGMQELATELKVNIGFLFKKQNAFDTGIAALLPSDSLLADYLIQTRAWSERLVGARNAIEHEGWALPRVKYDIGATGVTVTEPEISGQSMTEFVKAMLDRMCCFVEEVTVHCLQGQTSPEITITEIPFSKRLTEAPERFMITLRNGGRTPWRIAYHTTAFQEV